MAESQALRFVRTGELNQGSMPLPETGKLVRDRIPEIIRTSGREPVVEVLCSSDVRAALEMKLQEEVEELLTAPEDDRLEELSDIYEVLLALAREINATESDLQGSASTKRQKRGAFSDNLWLIDAGE